MSRVAGIALAALACVGVIVARGKAKLRAERRAVAGTYEYEYPSTGSTWQTTLTLRTNGKWTRINDLPSANEEHSYSRDSGTFELQDITLVLHSLGSPLPGTDYTVSGDTLYTRISRRIEQMERATGKRLPGREGFFVRTSRVP